MRTLLLTTLLAATAAAQTPTLSISLGLRETGAAGDTFNGVGAAGGTSGSLEWVDLDNQQLVLDGTWQQFTFDLSVGPFTGFTGDGVLDGAFGVIEHIRVRGVGVDFPVTIDIDDVVNTTSPMGTPVDATVEDFEGYTQGDEVMFQEPGFSGSTSGNLMAGGTSGADNFIASRSSSCRVQFQFVDNTDRWLRLTTFRAANRSNPQIRFDQNSVVTFWMRGGTAQENLGSQGPGSVIAEMFGPNLTNNQVSIVYTAGAPANAPGALLVSLSGQADIPFAGGNLVSFAGFVGSLALTADANGMAQLPVPGTANVFDVTLQAAFVDRSLRRNISISNALLPVFGQ